MKSRLSTAARSAPQLHGPAPLSRGRSNAAQAEKLHQKDSSSQKAHRASTMLTGQLASLGEEQRPLGALRAAFGPRVNGIRIEEGKSAENEKIGAEAHAEGKVVRLSENIDGEDPEAMGLLAHEVAHALAPQGQAQGLDQPGTGAWAEARTGPEGRTGGAETGCKQSAGPARKATAYQDFGE